MCFLWLPQNTEYDFNQDKTSQYTPFKTDATCITSIWLSASQTCIFVNPVSMWRVSFLVFLSCVFTTISPPKAGCSLSKYLEINCHYFVILRLTSILLQVKFRVPFRAQWFLSASPLPCSFETAALWDHWVCQTKPAHVRHQRDFILFFKLRHDDTAGRRCIPDKCLK